MSSYSCGDTVYCKIGYNNVCYADATIFEEIAPFYIVHTCENDYLALTPDSHYISYSFILNSKDCAKHSIGAKFAGCDVCYISSRHVVSVKDRMSGYHCFRCNNYCEWAEVNRLDKNGKGIFFCYLCRQDKYR